MKNVLTLSLDPKLPPDEAARVLARVRAVAEVDDAGLVSPDSKSAVARAMAYALLAPGSDAAEAAKRVAAVPGVVSCDVPPVRFAT